MMKSFICIVVVALALSEATPVKRFAGFQSISGIGGSTAAVGGLAGIGGSAGCVVTGNKLFANGFFLRELTASEQSELKGYEENVKEYKEAVKSALDEKRKTWENRSSGKPQKAVSSAKELPKAPEKPSFCSSADTTQYYFDGCMVQNNKLYVGREFARDLSSEELTQLKKFDTEMSKYQKYLSSTIQQQVQGLFGSGGSDFWSMLGGAQARLETTPAPAKPADITPVEAPTTPNFCTAIY